MNKLDLFIVSCKSEAWRRRIWRHSAFAISKRPANIDVEPYDLEYREDGAYFYNPDILDWEFVEDSTPDKSLYGHREAADFPEGSVPNHPEALRTTYGRMLFNWMVMCYAFGNKLPYMHKGMPNDIVKKFAPYVIDENPENVELSVMLKESDKKISFKPTEVERFIEALFELTSICPYITTTGTENSLTTHPDMIKRRTELFKEYEGRLTPANIAKIQNELVELDKEWCKGSDAELFYTSNKTYSVKRKKLFIMHGIENAFEEGNDFALIEKSLSEGWDMDNLIPKYNSIREGSYDRGNDTALGGEKVNFLQRIYQNAKIIEGDCGTLRVDVHKLTTETASVYLGMNMMIDGTPVELTQDNMHQHIGQVRHFRRPILCKAPLMDFCEVCATSALAKNKRAVAALIAAVGSAIMYAFMSAMHGTELSVAKYDFNIHLD